MKRLLSIIFLLGTSLSAQETTQITLIVEWNNAPVYDNVTSFTVTLTQAVGPVYPPKIGSPALFCILDKCKATFENVTPGGYYSTVYATNAAGNGPSALATYNVMTPSQVKDVTIRKAP